MSSFVIMMSPFVLNLCTKHPFFLCFSFFLLISPLLANAAGWGNLTGVHPAFNSKNASWDADTHTFTILENVQFTPDGTANWNLVALDQLKDSFYWNIPCDINSVIIGPNVTVTGHFRFSCEQSIIGVDRKTSIIYGTATKAWARGKNQIEDPGTHCARKDVPAQVSGDDILHDCEKWQYGGISVIPQAPLDALYTIKNLTVENARTYAITAIHHTLWIEGVNIINTRVEPDFHSNSDGIGGGKNTFVGNTFIDTWDDAIKLYKNNMHVEDVTIVHNANGAPFQLGWGDKQASSHHLKNIKVIAPGNKRNKYNLTLFANSGGRINTTIFIDGINARYNPNSQLNKCQTEQSMPLVYLANPESNLTLISEKADSISLIAPELNCGPGKLTLSSVLSDAISVQK